MTTLRLLISGSAAGSASARAGRGEKGNGAMATRIAVRLTGNLGLDDAERLLAELTAGTELSWREDSPAEDGRHLTGGLVELLLVAVVSRGAEMAFEGTVERVRELVAHWRERRLDPPSAEVEVVEVDVAEIEEPEEPEAEAPEEPEVEASAESETGN